MQNGLFVALLSTFALTLAGVAVCCITTSVFSVSLERFRASLIRQKSSAYLTQTAYFVGIPFAIVGISTGYMSGLSREPAVAALVPAMLTLVGSVGAYLMTKGKRSSIMATLIMVNFSVSVLVGISLGASYREEAFRSQNSVEARISALREEFLLQQYRKGLGLPERTNEGGVEEWGHNTDQSARGNQHNSIVGIFR